VGYYTFFALSVDPPAEDDLVSVLTEGNDSDYIGSFSAYEDSFSKKTIYVGSDWKWYDHEPDMLGLSEEFPEYVFQLVGNGEETGDYWVEYYKGGKSYKLSLVTPVPPFDESLLGKIFEKTR
jgi:hypothetical protein